MAELITMGSHQDQEFSKTQGECGHFYRQQAKPITIEMLKKKQLWERRQNLML